MQLSPTWHFSKADMKILLIVFKNSCKLHVVDVDGLKWRQQIKLNSRKIFFNRMISQTKRI